MARSDGLEPPTFICFYTKRTTTLSEKSMTLFQSLRTFLSYERVVGRAGFEPAT